jgi:hypothetical protein
MIVSDDNVMSRSEALKSLFGFQGVFGQGGLLRINKVESRGMIDEDGSDRVTALHELARTLCHQAGSFRDKLFNGNDVTGFRGQFADLPSMSSSAPMVALGFAEETTSAFGHVTICDSLG